MSVLENQLEKLVVITLSVMLIFLVEFNLFGLLQLHVSPEAKSDQYVSQIMIVKLVIFAGSCHKLKKEYALRNIMLHMELNSFGIASFTPS